MGIEVTSDIDVACDPAVAFALIADMSRNPEWQQGMKSCVWTTDPPIRVGSTYDQEAGFLGRTITTSFRVEEFVEPERIRIVSYVSTFPLDVTRTVEATEAGCRVKALVKGEPGRVAMLFAPLMRLMVQRSVRGDYQRLKALLEA